MGMLPLMSIGSFGHGGAFVPWMDRSRKDLVGVFLMQDSAYSGNAKRYSWNGRRGGCRLTARAATVRAWRAPSSRYQTVQAIFAN